MTRYFDFKRVKNMKTLRIVSWTIYIVMMFPMVVLIVASLMSEEVQMFVTSLILVIIMTVEISALMVFGKKQTRAARYGPIFEEDHDGVITYARINEMTGYGLEQTKKDVEWLMNARYLLNAVADDEKVILLSENDFLQVICPTCGAVNSVRAGSSNQCKHCGSYLRRV